MSRRVGVRAELAYRVDFNDSSFAAPNEDAFGDILASVGVVIPLGPEPTAPIAPAPAAPSCADMDSDGDGVNDCDDRSEERRVGKEWVSTFSTRWSPDHKKKKKKKQQIKSEVET